MDPPRLETRKNLIIGVWRSGSAAGSNPVGRGSIPRTSANQK